MKLADDLSVQLGEVRADLANLAADENADEKQSREMLGKLRGLEQRRAAAIAAEPETEPELTGDDAESRELRGLTDKASLGEIFAAAVDHGSPEGATRELQQHFELGPNQAPLSLFAEPDGPSEIRAVTAAPTNVGRRQAPILSGVFPQSVAAFLGVDMPTVPAGQATYPVLSVNAAVRAPAESGAAAETDGAFTAANLSPSRLQASFRYTRESAGSLAGLDAALRSNLRQGLGDGLDKQVIAGDDGLLTSTNLPNNNVSAVTTFDLYRSGLAYGRVDGIYAGSVADLRLVVGSKTYSHAASQFRGNNASVSALETLQAETAGVRVSAHVPAVASSKQNAVIHLGNRKDMVAAVWNGVTIIADPYSGSAKGEITVTAVLLHAVSISRAAGFVKQQTQHA